MARLLLANQATAEKRRVYFDARDGTDGITPETGEAGGQPQISTNGAAWTNTGIGTLSAIGNGRYYAELTQAAVATAGDIIETRFKSANTAETPGDSIQVVAFDPDDATALGLSRVDAAISSRLAPTVAARTLDVSAGGEAGIDWSNIGSPTTAQNLSATNIDVDQVVASVSGAVGSVTGSVGSVTGAVGSVTGNVGGNVTGSIGSLATQAKADVQAEAEDALVTHRLDELLNADSDIDGAAPPTVGSVFHELMTKTAGSFTYDQATDALEAIRDNMGTAQTGDAYARLGAPAGASVSADIAAVKSDTAATLADTNELQTDWANGGRLDNILDARASQTSVDDLPTNAELATALGTADDATLAAIAALNDPSAADIADAVWEEAIADHSGTVGSTAEALSAAGSAGDPWTTALPGAYGAGTAGKIVGDNLNATVSSRATQTSVDTIDDFVDIEVAAIKAKTDQLVFTTANKVDARAFTVDDKTGYALTSAYDPAKTAAQAGDAMALTSGERTTLTAAIWAALTSALTTVGSIGKLLVDNINATISSRLASASYTTPPTVGAIADQVWDEAIAGHAGAGSTGEALSNAGAAGTPPTAVEIADEVETRAMTLTSSERNAIADASLDRANAIETGVTPRGAQRLALAALAGKISGAGGTTVTIRNAVADSKDRIVATVDVNGDRTAITTDQT